MGFQLNQNAVLTCNSQPQYSALLIHRYWFAFPYCVWHVKGRRNESVTSCFSGWGEIPCCALTEVVCHVGEVLPVAARGLHCCTGLIISRRRTATRSIASALQCICVVCSVIYTYDIESTYRCAGLDLYRCAFVQAWRCTGVQVCRCTCVEVCSCTGVQVCRFTIV